MALERFVDMISMRDIVMRKPVFPQARRRCDVVVVSAVADGEWGGICDLLESLACYLDCRYEVVFAEDVTTDGTAERLRAAGHWVVSNPEKLNLAGNELTLRRGFREATRLFDAAYYMKLDPDALLLGPGLLDAVSQAFAADDRVGMVGCYRIGHDGLARDLGYWRKRMIKYARSLGRPYRLALERGYSAGDGVQGGAYVLSRSCMDAILAHGWFDGAGGYRPRHDRKSHIAEDSLIAMLTYASGYTVGEIGGPGQAFALNHRGLPMTVEELVAQKRLVVHSIKFDDDESRRARDFFRRRREDYAGR